MALSPSASSEKSASSQRRNWAGNYVFRSHALRTPDSAETLERVIGHAQQVRVLGSGHSFNSIADADFDSAGVQVSLEKLPASVTFDAVAGTVTAPAGFTYAQLTPFLAQQGVALHNLASLPHITIAGATQTGTHGSGLQNGSLSAAVEAFTICAANPVSDGREVAISRRTHGQAYEGMVVALGALGVVTSITLKTQPTFLVQQRVYQHLPVASLSENLQRVFSCGYSVSAFTNWDDREITQVWVKQRVDADASVAMAADALLGSLGMTHAQHALHPIPGHSAEHCTAQLGEQGAWHARLPHFRSDFTPSSGEELQSEYFVALSDGPAAIAAIAGLAKKIAPLLYVSELRTVAADELWLSPCFQRTALALHFTWHARQPAVMEVLEEIEAALAPFRARPHWAKLFVAEAAALKELYPRFEDFRQLRRSLDPSGRFDNRYLRRVLGIV